MPIIAATDEPQSGVSTTAASTPISADEMPSPNSAVAIGRPEATTLPKVTSSTSAAIRKPTVSDEISPRCALPITWPPSSSRTPAPASRRGQLDQPLAGRDRHLGRAARQRHAGDGDRAVARDLGRGGRRRRADALERRRLGQERVDALARGRRGGVLRRPHDVERVRGALGEALGEQVLRGLGLRAGRRVVGRPLPAQRAAGHHRGHEHGDPRHEHQPPAAEGEVGEPGEPAGRWGAGSTGRTSRISPARVERSTIAPRTLTADS